MKISTIGIIGCGTVAQGAARAIAQSKLKVVLYDDREKWLSQAVEQVTQDLDKDIRRWGITPGDKKAILKRIGTTTRLTDLKAAQVVIETRGRHFDEIRDQFLKLEEICSDETILLMNTTTASVSELQKYLRRPKRMMGIHFLVPVSKSVVVEIIKGEKTSDETCATVKIFVGTLRKRCFEVFEYPGYLTARIILPMINTAANVLMEGLASAKEIDDAIHLGFNLSLGPLAMADQMGIDVVLDSLDGLFKHLGDPTYRACPLLRRMVREGKLGVKSGEGFHRYDSQYRRIDL